MCTYPTDEPGRLVDMTPVGARDSGAVFDTSDLGVELDWELGCGPEGGDAADVKAKVPCVAPPDDRGCLLPD